MEDTRQTTTIARTLAVLVAGRIEQINLGKLIYFLKTL
jgi:hypothetical protein